MGSLFSAANLALKGFAVLCFDPRLGLRFNSGGPEVELVTCLACNWIHAYNGYHVKPWAPSKIGAQRLKKIYMAHA